MKHPRINEINNLEYKIVSLGHNCFPRTVLTRWGIKPDKAEGELTMPFDLATFETFEITKNIKENFETFFENLFYKNKYHIFKNNGHWVKRPDLIEFVHEKSLTKDDEQKLIAIYKKRIENFKICIEDNLPILFVQLIGDCDDSENLYNEISNLRGAKPFSFIVIDPLDTVKHHNENIKVLKIEYPTADYQKNWWKPKCYNSKNGKFFEEEIIDFCINEIKKLTTKK